MVTPCNSCPQYVQRERSKACCTSCAEGGPCSGETKSESSARQYQVINYQRPQVMTHRMGGVVPNYMGHIPGMNI